MYEHILAALPLNKSIALGGVKPLYCSLFFHTRSTWLIEVWQFVRTVTALLPSICGYTSSSKFRCCHLRSTDFGVERKTSATNCVVDHTIFFATLLLQKWKKRGPVRNLTYVKFISVCNYLACSADPASSRRARVLYPYSEACKPSFPWRDGSTICSRGERGPSGLVASGAKQVEEKLPMPVQPHPSLN